MGRYEHQEWGGQEQDLVEDMDIGGRCSHESSWEDVEGSEGNTYCRVRQESPPYVECEVAVVRQ